MSHIAVATTLFVPVWFSPLHPYDTTLTAFYAAPADFCHKLPDGISLKEGALIEPLAEGSIVTTTRFSTN